MKNKNRKGQFNIQFVVPAVVVLLIIAVTIIIAILINGVNAPLIYTYVLTNNTNTLLTNNTASLDFTPVTFFNLTVLNQTYMNFQSASTNGKFNITGFPFSSVGTNFTISVWVNYTNGSRVQFLSIGNDTNITGNKLYFGSNTGNATFYFRNIADVESTTKTNNSAWHNIVVRYNGTFIQLFVDGVQDRSRAANTANNTVSSMPTTIGGVNETSDMEDYLGFMDELRIYNDSLSNTQISAIFNSGRTKNESSALRTSLQGYYSFNENVGPSTTLPVYDTSLNSFEAFYMNSGDPTAVYANDGITLGVPAASFNQSGQTISLNSDNLDWNQLTATYSFSNTTANSDFSAINNNLSAGYKVFSSNFIIFFQMLVVILVMSLFAVVFLVLRKFNGNNGGRVN